MSDPSPGAGAPLVLHGYWRSSAAYRVRIALAFKRIDYATVPHNLLAGEQRADAYLALAPQGLVPAIEQDGRVYIQSPAILEWIEERWPEPPLLPADADGRAMVRAMAALIGCDIHPLNNLRVLRRLKRAFGQDQAGLDAWAAQWIAEGFAALEQLIARHGDGYAYGATPTLADCYLLPQVYSARRFNVDLGPYPTLLAVAERLGALPDLRAAAPEAQPDAPR